MRERTIHKILKRVLILLVCIYQQTLSLFFGPCCRFSPTCSSYALESIERFGAVEGIWLSIKRVLRCHPLHPGGYDPVPEITKND